MRRKTNLTLLTSLALCTVSFAASCGSANAIKGIHMSSPEMVQVNYGHFSYEGIGVTVDFQNGSSKEIALTEDMISEVEQMKFFKVGEWQIEVVYRGRFKTTMPVRVVLNQFLDSYELMGYECVYDGLPHSVFLNQELPEGATITFDNGNTRTNAGVYEIKGVISKNGYESKVVSTTLTIHKADRDAKDILFEDTTVVYNGEERTIEAKNVPEGVEVRCEAFDYDTRLMSKTVKAGKYLVRANFVDKDPDDSINYNQIPAKEAILTIEKARYDLSGVEIHDVVRTYDGQPYDVKNAITGLNTLPLDITPKPVCKDLQGNVVTSNANAGEYILELDFEQGDMTNYHPVEPIQAKLTVNKRVLKISDKVTFEGKTVDFDEQTHSLSIAGSLPENVEVTYENNDKIYAGEYEVKAKFAIKKATEVEVINDELDVKELTAYLVINRVRRAVQVYNEETGKYDKPFTGANIIVKDGVATIVGYDTEVFAVESKAFYDVVTNAPVAEKDLIVGKTYQYEIAFRYLDENMENSVRLSLANDNFVVAEPPGE